MKNKNIKRRLVLYALIICIIGVGLFSLYSIYEKKYDKPDRSGNTKMTMADKIEGKVEAELLDLNLIGDFNKEDGLVINDNRGIPVIGYHSIGSDSTGTSPLVISPEKFRKHLKTLADRGYTTLTLKQVEDYLLNDEPIPAKSVLLTFDDGYEDNYTNMFPILKEFKMNAVIFVIPTYLDSGEYLKRSQVKEMSDYGIDIESHTYTHKRLGDLPYEEQLKELTLSKKAVNDITGKDVTSIAYPEGIYNEDTIKAVKEAGYKMGFTIKRGYADRDDDIFELNRVCVDHTYEGKNLLYVLKGIEK
ncbi:MAG: polysaccharide deacetylase family protein [Clostridium sp.]|nr:polysaccharide deacetylase family protein [Clostridium sp.]